MTDLITYAEAGNLEKVKELLEKGADVNIQDEYSNTSLHEAAWNGHTETAKLLLEHGIDVNVQNKNGYTVLHMAARNGHTETAKLLLEHGADVNIQDKYGRTALDDAIRNGRTETVELIKAHEEQSITDNTTQDNDACKKEIQMKYNENTVLSDILEHIKDTYKRHYSHKDNLQTIDILESININKEFMQGNIIKYIMRYDKKNGVSDLYKAAHYIVLLIHFLEKTNDCDNLS